jgi:hypothetical protein
VLVLDEDTVDFVALAPAQFAIEFDLFGRVTVVHAPSVGDPPIWKRAGTIWLVLDRGAPLCQRTSGCASGRSKATWRSP